MIAATAWLDEAVYASAETTGKAVQRARREGIAAMHFDDFAAFVSAFMPSPP